MTITYQTILSPSELDAVVDLHCAAWATDEADAIPTHMMTALQHAGGLLVGAYDEARLVAFALSFIGQRGETLLHWSHEAAVHPDYQGRGIGSRLKWFQREQVLARGYNCIAWTFDPLQSRNANLNIHKLGAACNTYLPNHYGSMQDGLNAGIPSDRFEVHWWLNTPAVQARADGAPVQRRDVQLAQTHQTLVHEVNASIPGQIDWPTPETARTLVEIPADINALRQAELKKALEWRLKTRTVFERLFAEGYAAADFCTGLADAPARTFYLLEKPAY